MDLPANMTHFSRADCRALSPFCPVEATVLGYAPNLGSSIFFATAFAILTISSFVLGIWKRTYTYCIGLTLGLVLEMAGYIGRALLHKNPWNSGAFDLQITAIILAPTAICVSIYLTLKHVILSLNPHLSRIQPRLYPLLFLPADLSCLIIQAVGGGIAAAGGKTNRKFQNGGSHAIIAGVALQVVVLAVFGLLSADYYRRVKKYMASPEAQGTSAVRTWNDAGFRKFVYAMLGSYVTILIRCIYRIAEMAGGWGNHIMQDQPSFLVLDSSLVLVATFLLVVFHPGIYFPAMRKGGNGNGGAHLHEKNAPSPSSQVHEESGSSSDNTKA